MMTTEKDRLAWFGNSVEIKVFKGPLSSFLGPRYTLKNVMKHLKVGISSLLLYMYSKHQGNVLVELKLSNCLLENSLCRATIVREMSK